MKRQSRNVFLMSNVGYVPKNSPIIPRAFPLARLPGAILVIRKRFQAIHRRVTEMATLHVYIHSANHIGVLLMTHVLIQHICGAATDLLSQQDSKLVIVVNMMLQKLGPYHCLVAELFQDPRC